MATYAQILKSTAQGRRQWWYISGTVPALVQDAYELALAHVRSSNVSVAQTTFVGSEASLWDVEQALSEDYEEDRALVVLHEADKFEGWDELTTTLRTLDTSKFFIAVSNAAPPSTKDTWAKTFVGTQKARFVVCNPMTPVDLSTWVKSRLNITQDAENLLIQRSWGDYDWLLNQIRKLEYIDCEVVDKKLVDVLCAGSGTPDLVDNLTRAERGKRAVLVSMEKSPPTAQTLDAVTRRLAQLTMLKAESKSVNNMSKRLLMERTALTEAEISVLWERRAYYDPQVSLRCFTALTRLYEGLLRGDRTAYLALLTRW